MSKLNRIRRKGRAGFLGAISLVTLLALARVLTQLFQDPSRLDTRLVILLQVVAGAAAFVGLAALFGSVLFGLARRTLAAQHPGELVYVAVPDRNFAGVIERVAGEALPPSLLNPRLLVDCRGISVWRGLVRPQRCATVNRSNILDIKSDFDELGRPCVSVNLVDGNRLIWAIRRPIAIGLVMAKRPFVSRAVEDIRSTLGTAA